MLAEFALSLGLSENTDRFRASQIVHSVQNMDGDRDFGSSRLLGMRSKGVADDTLVSTNPGLDQSAPIVAARHLPTAAALAAMSWMCPSRWERAVLVLATATARGGMITRVSAGSAWDGRAGGFE